MPISETRSIARSKYLNHYPLDVTEYTFEEAKSIVDVARTWNTYVAVHINTKEAIKTGVEAGAMSREHGFFIDEETARLMAENGVWWSMQPMEAEGPLAFKFESPISTAKYVELVAQLENANVVVSGNTIFRPCVTLSNT